MFLRAIANSFAGKSLFARALAFALLTCHCSYATASNVANNQGVAAGNAVREEDERKSISVQTQIAAGELSRVEQEILRLTREKAEIEEEEALARALDAVRPQYDEVHTSAGGYCTATEEQQLAFRESFTSLVARLQRITSNHPAAFPWEFSPYDPASFCPSGLQNALQQIGSSLGRSADPARRQRIERELSDLQIRRSNVIREMSEGVAGARVANNIPWLMLIIFGVGAVILAGLKLFPETIQQELVGSGQIVQFVTILILLGVILALGLAERLQAETLGTLLGGLAGYVLSQGIGRQERRRVLDEIRSVAASQGQ